MYRRWIGVFLMIGLLISGHSSVEAASKRYMYTDTKAKVYVSANTKARVYKTFNVNTKVLTSKHNRSWSIVYSGGRKYYIPTRDLSSKKVSVVTTKSKSVKKEVRADVKVYSSASTKSKVVRKYVKGDVLSAYRHSGSWDYVMVSGKKYYIPSRYLVKFVEKKQNMYALKNTYVYTSPKSTSKVYRMLNEGQAVTVAKYSSSWSTVFVGTKRYYVVSKYLSSKKPVVRVVNPSDRVDSIPLFFRSDGVHPSFKSSVDPVGLTGIENPVRDVKKFTGSMPVTNKIGSYSVVYHKGTIDVLGDFSWVDKSKGIDVEVRYGDQLSNVRKRHMSFKGDDVVPINTEVLTGRYIVLLSFYYKKSENTFGKANYGWYVFELEDARFGTVDSDEIQYSNDGIRLLANTITRGKTTQVDKSRAIYEWISKNVSYDIDELNRSGAKFYTAEDTLRLRKVMCTGYANLNAALHRAIGIEAVVVYGQAGGGLHAWNEIRLGNEWYFQDTTWGAGYVIGDRFYFDYREKYMFVDYPDTHTYQGTYNY